MIRLTERQLISMHSSPSTATGDIDGFRDNGLLESALEAPWVINDEHFVSQ